MGGVWTARMPLRPIRYGAVLQWCGSQAAYIEGKAQKLASSCASHVLDDVKLEHLLYQSLGALAASFSTWGHLPSRSPRRKSSSTMRACSSPRGSAAAMARR